MSHTTRMIKAVKRNMKALERTLIEGAQSFGYEKIPKAWFKEVVTKFGYLKPSDNPAAKEFTDQYNQMITTYIATGMKHEGESISFPFLRQMTKTVIENLTKQ